MSEEALAKTNDKSKINVECVYTQIHGRSGTSPTMQMINKEMLFPKFSLHNPRNTVGAHTWI